MYYITYKNQELPVIIDYSVIKKMAISKGVTGLNNLNALDLDGFEATEKILFLALERGHKIEGKEFTITESESEEILNECFADFQLIVSECTKILTIPSGPVKKK